MLKDEPGNRDLDHYNFKYTVFEGSDTQNLIKLLDNYKIFETGMPLTTANLKLSFSGTYFGARPLIVGKRMKTKVLRAKKHDAERNKTTRYEKPTVPSSPPKYFRKF